MYEQSLQKILLKSALHIITPKKKNSENRNRFVTIDCVSDKIES